MIVNHSRATPSKGNAHFVNDRLRANNVAPISSRPTDNHSCIFFLLSIVFSFYYMWVMVECK